ncbi:MAG: glucose 1-dehydrogenase [Chloroflexota bacterium]|nr:glucose 1-dehydrogenase [Chloroflexota bacterium]
MGRLDGKVVLISGAAKGQGATEAIMFAAEGAKIVLGDILDEEGLKIESQIRELGGEATYVHLDVTQEADWDKAVHAAVDNYGVLDVLVNNAGILIRKSIEDTTVEDWDRIMNINAKGVFLGTKAAIPALRAAGGGSIINISSTAGLVSSSSGSASYTATKGAVRLFTKSTAIQYAKDGIRCNSVHPGPIETDMIHQSITDPNAMALRMEKLPMGRLGKPEEVANGVLYLASDESSFVTGSELVIDGGSTAQ